MTRILFAGAAALALMSSGAFAQTRIIEETTTQVQPATPTMPAPAETVTKSMRSKSYNSDGSETITRESVQKNSAGGVSSKSQSRTIQPDGSSSVTTKEKVAPAYGPSTESETTTTIER